jgi:hypothetical protein
VKLFRERNGALRRTRKNLGNAKKSATPAERVRLGSERDDVARHAALR